MPRSLPQDTVATVGTAVITAADLLRRMELMPYPDLAHGGDPEEVKRRSLYAMLAERVLANEAKRERLPEDATTQRMRHELENLFVRDELFKREIEQKAIPAESDVYQAVRRFEQELTVECFLTRTGDDATALVRALRKRTPPARRDSIIGSLATERDTILIHFDGPDSAFERAAYGIGASGVSAPVHSEQLGWAVLVLLDVRPSSMAQKMNVVERRDHVVQILKRRIEMQMQDAYARQVLATRTARGDTAVFNLFADSLIALWRTDPEHFHRDGGYVVTADMADLLLEELADQLDRPLVRIDDGDVTLGQFLEMMRYENFVCSAYEGWQAKLELNEEVRHVVGRELLAREGRRQNLQFSTAVQNELSEWTDYWAARQLLYRVRDSVRVTDDEIVSHLVRNSASFGGSYEVNVREILCKDLATASVVLSALNSGKTPAELAPQYSLRAEWASRGGESGYFPVREHPELGFRALMAPPGVLQGPFKLDGGYSIFTVLGTRRTKSALTDFATLRRNVEQRLLEERKRDALNRFIAACAREQQVSVDDAALRKIHPTMIPMFTRRYMGFGGIMSGAPILMHQWDWYQDFQKANPLP